MYLRKYLTLHYTICIYLMITYLAADSDNYYNSDLLSTSNYDSSESTSSYDYYDDYYHDTNDAQKNTQSGSEQAPYECPLQCKCIFNQVEEQNDLDENRVDHLNDYEHEMEENFRKKRNSNVSYDYDDYLYDLSTKLPSSKTKKKYQISVDCSNQNLNSISYLFSYDFPLDQIVSFNLSNNRFRILRLDDGFEDLINLRIIDISSNNYLRSPSAKYFLKKFRFLEKIYMNNLEQINCDQTLNSNKLVSIDCQWLRTILYLFKRNISVIIDKPNKCDASKLVNSVSLMSRCFRDLYNSYRFTDTNQTLLSTDNSKFEFRIEPELNQILIEGDTLELTCKLKKINLKKLRSKSSNFYKSQIKWVFNDQTQLMISTIYYTKDTPTQIQILENKSKFKQDDLIESKLVITNTISGQHTGKYSCVAGLHLNDKRLNVNTSQVEIKVLTRHQLNVIEPSVQEIKKKSPYCPEIITQTYKGIFKWPRTLANSKITQKCTGTNSSAFVIFECKQDGQWSDHMNLSACFFESNLTKYLFALHNSNKEINLEEFIRQIVSIQSNHNSTSKQSLNAFDVINVQKYLIELMSKNQSAILNSNSWKHEFMFLNDMLSKINEFYLKQAKLSNRKVYGNYFFNVLMEVLSSSKHKSKAIQSDVLSSYLAMNSISSFFVHKDLKQNLSCKLKKYQLTQQMYFKCDEHLDSRAASRIDFDHQMISSYSQFSKKLQFIFFENDYLLPSLIQNQTYENLSNYDLINLVDYNRLLDSNELNESTDKLISQIVGFVSAPNFNQPNRFNLSLEIKMPDLYFRVLDLIGSKLDVKRTEIKKQNSSVNKKKIEKDKNLFDQIFIQNSLLTETNSLYFDISTSTPKTSNNVLLMNKNLVMKNYDSSIGQIYDKHFLSNSDRLKRFKNLLINNWFRVHRYQVLYGMLKNDTNGPHIEWSEKNFNAICDIKRLVNSPNSTNYAIFSHLECKLTAKNHNIHFIGLRHAPNFEQTVQSEPIDANLFSIIRQIDEYADLYRINIKDELNTNQSIISQLQTILNNNYQFFSHKVFYFFSLISILILSANIIIYLILKKSLLMPRSFQHCIINKWVSVLFLILFYVIGIKQIFIAHLCFVSAIATHYLMLSSFIWYLLYYWCLYSKLRVLEKRNFNLIFNNDDVQLKKSSGHEEDDEYIKKPVVHLYMLGYGVPLLLVSIIVSITKRDYVLVPYSLCFTNEPNILIGSIILPVCFVFLIQLVLVGLIWATLKRIVKDLDIEELDKKPQNDKIYEDKKELCKNWLINKDLNANDCIEVKTNPITQKSVVNLNRDAYPDSNTSFNSDSDRTSIMDTQHKPHIQLKFSLFSSFIFLCICVLAGCVTTLDHELIFTYVLSVALFIYSVLEISFYVLSRDDLFSLELNFSFSFSNDKIKSDVSTENNSNETNSQENNWYFESNESKAPSCPKMEDLYERYNFNDLNSTKKNVTNTILEEESMEEDEHKRSISDALFSAKKSLSMSAKPLGENINESKVTENRPSLAVPEDSSDSTVYGQKIYESKSKKVKKSFYSYEEKSRADQVIIEEYVSRLDDLLSSNCLMNTGAAVETVATIAKVKRRSNGSMTSSVVTTSNESNFNQNHLANPQSIVNSYLGEDDIYATNSIYQSGSSSQKSYSVCSNVWQKNSIERASSKFAARNKASTTSRSKAVNLSINHETSV